MFRRRRRLLWLLLLAATACSTGDAPSPAPTLVLVVVDTLRAGSLSSYGNPRRATPRLDALAADGLRFTRAYSQAPWTTASIGSLLTSRYPSALGLRDLDDTLPPDAVLVSERLSAAGYTTGAVVSHVLCGAGWGFDRGFDVFDESNALGHDAVTSPAVTDRALAFLATHPRERVFLFVHYFDPHYAYIEQPFGARADPAYRGPIRSGMPFAKLRRRRGTLRAPDVAELLRIYDSEVTLTDHEIGRLLDGLRASGRYDDALIVVTADHGEEFLEHGDLGHIDTLYDELVRVPLLLKPPRAAAASGAVVDTPVPLLDVAPTLLEAAGLPASEELGGRSLFAAREGRPRAVFTETSNRVALRAVIAGRHKLILDLERGSEALYDLEDDPGERSDRSRDDPARSAALRRRLDAWMRQHPPPPAPSTRELDDDARAHLRALGYH